MRVCLITTGDMEFKGLGCSLHRLFPNHDFITERYSPDKAPFHGFTASLVQPLALNDPPGKAAALLRAALGTLMSPDEATPAADLAVILEDLELVNRGNEDVLIEHVRESARRTALSNVNPARIAGLLREHVSFHLAVPMTESWFFGDLVALQTEVPSTSWPPLLIAGQDPEDFRTTDPNYLADNGSACSALLAKAAGGSTKKRPDWVTDRRDEHPKRYIQWLMRDPTTADCTRYKESYEGVRLLEKMDWKTVLALDTWFPYLRALVRDLEDVLGPSPYGLPAGGYEAPRTSRTTHRATPVLRNL